MVKCYHVRLTDDHRRQLEQLISRGKTSARVITRARILLRAADGWKDDRIVEAVGRSRATVERVRRRFAEEGLDAALKDKPQPGRPRALTRPQAAHVYEYERKGVANLFVCVEPLVGQRRTITWPFTAYDARDKLRRLYPIPQS